jgi:hypothetical protein
MKRAMSAVIALVSLLTFTGIFVADSFAAKPGILPTPTAASPVTATSKSGTTTFGAGFTTLTSASSTGTEAFTSESGGTGCGHTLIVRCDIIRCNRLPRGNLVADQQKGVDPRVGTRQKRKR